MKLFLSVALAGIVSVSGATGFMAQEEKAYGPGVTDTEIKIGNTNPYSGPALAYELVGRVEDAYFKMINEAGGVNQGRKINCISYDDAYSPPKTVEQTRQTSRKRRSIRNLQFGRHADKPCRAEISQCQESTAIVRVVGGRQFQLAAEIPLEHEPSGQLQRRGRYSR